VTPTSRILIVLSIILLPTTAAAYVIETDYQHPQTYSPNPSSASSASSEQLKESAEEQQWNTREARNEGFWANMMNRRKLDQEYKSGNQARREKLSEIRQVCRTDIRKANIGSMLPITQNCYRAVLSSELEILRKQKHYVFSLTGPAGQYITGAIFHIQNLSDAISAVIKGIDSGSYQSKEDLQEVKKSLAQTYLPNKDIAMTQVRISRTLAWLNHIIVRLETVKNNTAPEGGVLAKIDMAITCFETEEEQIKSLLSLEDNDTLIPAFRQGQSDVKFCIQQGLEAALLNKELEQANAEN